MNVRRIAAIALSYRDYESVDEKIAEACRWVSLAGEMGCDLAVLPECIDKWRGDGPGNPKMLTVPEELLECSMSQRVLLFPRVHLHSPCP